MTNSLRQREVGAGSAEVGFHRIECGQHSVESTQRLRDGEDVGDAARQGRVLETSYGATRDVGAFSYRWAPLVWRLSPDGAHADEHRDDGLRCDGRKP